MKSKNIANCKTCNREFIKTRFDRLYCTPKCSVKPYKPVIKKKKTCITCGCEFETNQYSAKVCSKACRKVKKKLALGSIIGRGNLGAAVECHVSADFLLKGWNVFRSMSPNCFCDLIVTKDDIIMMVEVRSGHRELNGHIGFCKIKRSDKVTHFAVWIPGELRVYVIEADYNELVF